MPGGTASDTGLGFASENDMEIDSIPVATTPPGGWSEWPSPILAGCSEPRPAGAPDLDGFWRTDEALVDGQPVPGHPALGHVTRIEQRGDRMVVTGGGVIHDMRCDGTLANGVHDVAEFDKKTEINVIASYEDGVHVLRPQGLDLPGVSDGASGGGAGGGGSSGGSDSSGEPIEVRRWREGEHLLWKYIGFTARMTKLAPSETNPTKVFAAAAKEQANEST